MTTGQKSIALQSKSTPESREALKNLALKADKKRFSSNVRYNDVTRGQGSY